MTFDPGYVFRCRPQPHFALRLCYSAVPEADIEKGVRRLAAVLDTVGLGRR